MSLHSCEERDGQGSVDVELCVDRVCASTKYDDDAMMRAALGCCCCCIVSIILTSLIRCFKSASMSVTSLLLSVSLSVAVTVGVGVSVAATATAWDTFSPTDTDPLLFSNRRESRKLSLIGVISATARAFPEFDAVIRPLNGRSRAFKVLRITKEL